MIATLQTTPAHTGGGWINSGFGISFGIVLDIVSGIGVLAISLLYSMLVVADSTDQYSSGDKQALASVVVYGTAVIRVEPDELSFVIGIDARALTASQAYRAVESKMSEVMSLLVKRAIPREDVQAMQLSLQPVIDYQQDQRIIGHDARRDVLIRLADIDQYGEIMEALSTIDITRFQQLQLGSSQRQQLQIQALEAAYSNAETKARRLALKSGNRLGGLLKLVEQGNNQPQLYNARMSFDAEAGAAATTSKGTINVSASVIATFNIES